MLPEFILAGLQAHPDAISLMQLAGAAFCLFVIGQALQEVKRWQAQDRCARAMQTKRCWPVGAAPKSCRGCQNVS